MDSTCIDVWLPLGGDAEGGKKGRGGREEQAETKKKLVCLAAVVPWSPVQQEEDRGGFTVTSVATAEAGREK